MSKNATLVFSQDILIYSLNINVKCRNRIPYQSVSVSVKNLQQQFDEFTVREAHFRFKLIGVGLHLLNPLPFLSWLALVLTTIR